MGLNAKTKGKTRGLADMTEAPTAEVYSPPPEHCCDVLTMPVLVDDDGTKRYYWVQHIYRGQVVHFSVEIHIRDHAMADWQTVYRIDTSHGTVHEHRFRKGGDTQRVELHQIPTSDAWEFVSEWFERALTMCNDEWSKQIERWQQ